jgi:hypothetical protein
MSVRLGFEVSEVGEVAVVLCVLFCARLAAVEG